ncbi:MAG: putative PEP-CTERM system TPR-repeat lipoprotein [Paraglaciecola sp.]|jgi:putative PEP-CTERM system TPR-repeat lipoprotein
MFRLLPFIFMSFLFCSPQALAQSAAADYEKALQSFNNKNYEEAYIHLRNSLQDNPAHLPSKLMMGEVLVTKGLANAAIYELQEAIEFGADRNLAEVTMAEAYMLKMDYQKVTNFALADLNSKNKFELILLQAAAFMRLENAEKALAKYHTALSMQPNSTKANTALAAFYLQQNNLEKAQELIFKSSKIDPGDAHTLHLQGQLSEHNKQFKHALEYYEKAYEKAPSDQLIKRSLANSYVFHKKYEKARVIVDAILKKTPDEPFIMLLNARLFSMNNENKLADEAFTSLNQKLTLVPDNIMRQLPELHYVNGLASYMIGNYQSSLKALQLYLTEKPNDSNAIALVVDIHIKLRQTHYAQKLLVENRAMVMQNLPLSLVLCELYIKDNQAARCDELITELRQIFTQQLPLDLMWIKSLQSVDKYAQALVFLDENLSNRSEQVVQRLRVNLYLQNMLGEKALPIVESLLVTDPSNINDQLLKSDVLIAIKRYSDAGILVNDILRQEPNFLKAQFNQAQILFLKGQYGQAESKAYGLKGKFPASYRLNMLLANSLIAQGKKEQALKAYFTAKSNAKDRTDASEQIATIYRQLGELDLALNELNLLSDQHFLHPKYIMEKAEVYLSQENFEKAAQEFTLLSNLWHNDHQRLLLLGQVQRTAKMFESAEKSLLRSLAISPNFLYSKIELMRLYLTQGRISDAEVINAKLLLSYKDNADVQLIAGDIAFANKQFKQAQKNYLYAVQLNNNYDLPAIRLYNLAKTQNIGRKAFEKTISDIVSQYPESHFHRNLLADFLFSINKLEQAKEHYLRLAEVPSLPNKQYVLNNLANILINENPKKALYYIDKALELDKTDANLLDTKGWIHTLQSRHETGLNFLRQAFSMDTEDPAIRYHLAYTLMKLGRVDEAKMELAAALSSPEQFDEKQSAITLKDSF